MRGWALWVLVAGCAAPASRYLDTPLRLDGLYRVRGEPTPTTVNRPYWNNLRFFADGGVITASTSGGGSPLQSWLTKEQPGVSRGTFRIEGNKISFSATSRLGTVDYTGVIDGDKLRLRTYSHINQHKGSGVYVFKGW